MERRAAWKTEKPDLLCAASEIWNEFSILMDKFSCGLRRSKIGTTYRTGNT